LAGSKIGQFQRTECDSPELADRVSQHQHHASDLAIPALGEHDPHPRSVTLCLQDSHRLESSGAGASCAVVGQVDPPFQPPDECGIDLAVHGDVVDAGDVMRWMGQQVGKHAVVGQQEEPGRVHVQSAHAEQSDSGRMLDEINRPPSMFLIGGGADDAAGLEEHDAHRRGMGTNRLPMHRDVIRLGVHPCRQLRDEVAVDADRALRNQLFAGAARGNAGRCKHFLQANAAAGVSQERGVGWRRRRIVGRGRPSGRNIVRWLWGGGHAVLTRAQPCRLSQTRRQREASMKRVDDPSHSEFFASCSMAIAVGAWIAGLLIPVIALGPMGFSVADLAGAGGDHAMESRQTAMAVVALLALCGFLAIVGVLLGLLGASLATRARRRAVVAVILNAIAWCGVAVFFVASFGG